MRQTSRLTRTIVCALTLVVGVPGYPRAASSQGDAGPSTPTSYTVKQGDVDPSAVHAVAANLGVGRHVEIRTLGGKWRGRIHDIRENTYHVDTNGGVREVAYDETRSIKGTMPREHKVGIGVVIGIVAAGVMLHWVHRLACEC